MSTAQTKPKNKEDPRAVKAARLFVLMEQYPEDKLSVINAMKARRYKEDEATKWGATDASPSCHQAPQE